MEGERPRFTTEEISKYLEKFYTSEARESVVKELVSSDILKRGLESPEGKLILANTIDLVRSNMMKIVRLAIDGGKTKDIEHCALQISLAYDFMCGIAGVLTKGEEHEKGLKA